MPETILFKLRDRARQLPEGNIMKDAMKGLADAIHDVACSLVQELTDDNMRRLQGYFSLAHKALKDNPVPEAPKPRGGAGNITKNVRAFASYEEGELEVALRRVA